MNFELRCLWHALATLAFVVVLGGAASADPLTYKPLTLINFWEPSPAPTRTPSVAIDSENNVHLRGAIYRPGGNGPLVPFVLPNKFRPSGTVYLSVSLVVARTGRLVIESNGTVTIKATGDESDATAFTSLEGVIFSKH